MTAASRPRAAAPPPPPDPTLDPAAFRAALAAVPSTRRDAWLDARLGLGELPEDDPALPRGCVPYLPCPIDALTRAAERAAIGPADTVVDIGAGLGRALLALHHLTGAAAIGVEVQPALAAAARALVAGRDRVEIIAGDIADHPEALARGTVFFLYCPFSGDRLARLLDALEAIAAARPIRICAVDLPMPSRPWLEVIAASDDLVVYRSAQQRNPVE